MEHPNTIFECDFSEIREVTIVLLTVSKNFYIGMHLDGVWW